MQEDVEGYMLELYAAGPAGGHSSTLLTEMKMLRRFSSVGSCGMSFWTTLLKASNIEWSYMLVR